MKKVGIKLLKNKLSEYLRLVAEGEVILVTDRDQVVAELRAPSPGVRTALQSEKLADLVRRGLIALPTHRGPLTPLPPDARRMTPEEFQAMINDDMRDDRWPPT